MLGDEECVEGTATNICDVVDFMKILESEFQGPVFNKRAQTDAELAMLTLATTVDVTIVGKEHRVFESCRHFDHLGELGALLAGQVEIKDRGHAAISNSEADGAVVLAAPGVYCSVSP